MQRNPTLPQTCGQCGATFFVFPSQVGRRSTCSQTCKQLARKKRLPEERFWEKVLKTDSCWLWLGTKTDRGYGKFNLTSRHPVLAHRFAWELTNGSIPEEMDLCHDCPGGDNPHCVNPDHLFLGTHADNMRDAGVKGQMARGNEHPHAKLTDDKVRDIRSRHASGATNTYLAWYHGVSVSTVSEITRDESWKHVT